MKRYLIESINNLGRFDREILYAKNKQEAEKEFLLNNPESTIQSINLDTEEESN